MFDKNNFLLALIVILACSCATSSVKLGLGEEDWKSRKPEGSSIKHSIYLIGDVGGAKMGETTIPLMELQKQLKSDAREDEATDVVFLGDNIYPVGMPPVGHKKREEAEHRLNVQLEAVRAFDGNITFVPGNHDWYEYGREGLKRQEDHIENYLSQYNETFTDFFRPSNGCGNVDVMIISDKIALVSIDSHWFLTDKPKEYDYSDCEIQTRQEFCRCLCRYLIEFKRL